MGATKPLLRPTSHSNLRGRSDGPAAFRRLARRSLSGLAPPLAPERNSRDDHHDRWYARRRRCGRRARRAGPEREPRGGRRRELDGTRSGQHGERNRGGWRRGRRWRNRAGSRRGSRWRRGAGGSATATASATAATPNSTTRAEANATGGAGGGGGSGGAGSPSNGGVAGQPGDGGGGGSATGVASVTGGRNPNASVRATGGGGGGAGGAGAHAGDGGGASGLEAVVRARVRRPVAAATPRRCCSTPGALAGFSAHPQAVGAGMVAPLPRAALRAWRAGPRRPSRCNPSRPSTSPVPARRAGPAGR